jgi:hypothetical protein
VPETTKPNAPELCPQADAGLTLDELRAYDVRLSAVA